MLTRIRRLAKRSKTILIAYSIYDNWCTRKRFKSGHIVRPIGSEATDSLDYVNRVFSFKYSGISVDSLQDKNVLEVGPGGNLGIALKFLAAGARQVVCIDKFRQNVIQKMSINFIKR